MKILLAALVNIHALSTIASANDLSCPARGKNIITLRVGIESPSENIQTVVESRPCGSDGLWARGPRTDRLCLSPGSGLGERRSPVDALATINPQAAWWMRVGPARAGMAVSAFAATQGGLLATSYCPGGWFTQACWLALGYAATGAVGLYASYEASDTGMTRVKIEASVLSAVKSHQAQAADNPQTPGVTWYRYTFHDQPNLPLQDQLRVLEEEHENFSEQVSDVMKDFQLTRQSIGFNPSESDTPCSESQSLAGEVADRGSLPAEVSTPLGPPASDSGVHPR